MTFFKSYKLLFFFGLILNLHNIILEENFRYIIVYYYYFKIIYL